MPPVELFGVYVDGIMSFVIIEDNLKAFTRVCFCLECLIRVAIRHLFFFFVIEKIGKVDEKISQRDVTSGDL